MKKEKKRLHPSGAGLKPSTCLSGLAQLQKLGVESADLGGYNVFTTRPGIFLVKDETEALEIISARQRLFEQKGLGKLLVFLKSGNEFIGTCGLEPYKIGDLIEVELGYRLLLRHWGKGYASEAAAAILKYGLEDLKLPKVIAFALPQNKQSVKIIKKLGFKYLAMFHHGDLPHELYEISAKEFAKCAVPSNQDNHTCFAIILDKVPNKEASPAIVAAHVAHLRKLDQQGQLVLSGPFIDAPSGMVIVKAKNKEEAIAIAASDPFVVEGVRKPEVKTWLIACAENNYLG